ncbi:MAG TPA: hypothetical protein VGA38_13555 [Candidatus Limnocylindria bacterium]
MTRLVVARLLLLLTVAFCAIDAAILVVFPRGVFPGEFGIPGYQLMLGLGEGVTGYLVAARRPRTPVGWALLIAGVAISFSGAAHEIALASPAGTVRDLGAWLDAWPWAVNTGALLFAFFRFPDGQPVGRGWRRIEGAALAFVGLGWFLSAFVPGRILSSGLENPFGWSALASLPPSATNAPASPATLLAAASLIVRYRRSRGVERLQLKWLVSSVAVIGLAALAMVSSPVIAPALVPYVQIGLATVTVLIPISIGIAVLRYRLYDIDVLINRALVYGATTAGIAIAFFAGIVVLQSLLRPLTSGSELAVAASTLVSFALFQPLRRRIQDAVDRRFYRSRYDAARTLDAFSVQLRDEVDLDAVRAELVSAVRDTVQPAHASVWLR